MPREPFSRKRGAAQSNPRDKGPPDDNILAMNVFWNSFEALVVWRRTEGFDLYTNFAADDRSLSGHVGRSASWT
jgi:hypothetical protein